MSIFKYLNENLDSSPKIDARKLYRNRVSYHESLVELFSDPINEEDDEEETEIIDGDETTPETEPKNKEDKVYKSNDATEDVISLLKSNDDFQTDGKSFASSVAKNKYPEMLTTYDLDGLSKMKLFKLPNYDIGYALKDFTDPNGKVHPFGEVVSVHNSEKDVRGIGKLLMRHAIKNGAMALDHFDTTKLSPLYDSMGFKVYAKDEYDAQYDPDGTFKKAFGEVPVLYRMR